MALPAYYDTCYSRIYNTELPSSYEISLPLPIPPDSTPQRASGINGQIITIDDDQDWPISPKELASSQTIFVTPVPGRQGLSYVTLDTAHNLIPYFPGLVTGNVYKIEFVNLSATYTFVVRGVTGSNLLGVTGSVYCTPQGTIGYCQPVYIRWDNVAGNTGSVASSATGSYTII